MRHREELSRLRDVKPEHCGGVDVFTTSNFGSVTPHLTYHSFQAPPEAQNNTTTCSRSDPRSNQMLAGAALWKRRLIEYGQAQERHGHKNKKRFNELAFLTNLLLQTSCIYPKEA
jgi:hypothetical protein